MKIEYSNLEIKEIRSTTDEGVVEAYLTAWDTVDSYKTTFQRGCFKRTFSERGHKIKLLWNHDQLAGKVTECREDDYGPFVSVQFNLETQIGRESFAHVRAGDVDAFSFGFNVIKDNWESGVRTFEEVKVLECGPVVFPANEAAKVADVRAEDFDETMLDNELSSKGWKLYNALCETFDCIFYGSDTEPESITAKIDTAISKFHSAYMTWLSEYFNKFGQRKDATKYLTRTGNQIQEAIKNIDDIEAITRETPLTQSDIDRLKSGKLLTQESRSKLPDLPETIRTAHQGERRNTVERLCNEIRESGFSNAEKQRFSSLLGINDVEYPTIDEALTTIEKLRKTIR